MLDCIALGMLLENDLTGYDIKKFIENGIGVFYKASFGSLYPALKKLTQQGAVTTYEKPQGGRQKIYYKITESGKIRFFEWLSSPMDIFEGTNTYLAKVYFFDRLPTKIRDQQLMEYEIKNITYLKKLNDLEKHFSNLKDDQSCYYKLSTLYYGISITQRVIEWCQHIREQKPLSDLIESE